MMKLYRFPEKRGWNTAFGVYMLLILLLARDTMYSQALMSFYTSQILMIGVMGIGVLAFVWCNRRELKQILTDSRLLLAIVCAVLICLPMVIKRDWQLMYFSILLCILFAVFLSYFVRLKEVARTYVLILCALAVYSLLATYVLRLLPDNGLVSVPIFLNGADHDFYNFGLGFVSVSYVKTRNFGIFREPGVYQFFILLALYLTNYTVQWKKERSMWLANAILAVTMLSTQATGGVIELGLFVIVVFFEKKLYRDRLIRTAAIIAVLAMAAVLAVSFVMHNAIYRFVYDTLLQKFVDRTASVTERTEAIKVNLQLLAANPIFGTKLSEVLHAVRNNTSSNLILYAAFGVVSGTLNVVAWFVLVWKKERCFFWNLMLLAILAMSFNTQNLIADTFFWLFPVMALTERALPLLKLPEKG